jgi:hypothetical protein
MRRNRPSRRVGGIEGGEVGSGDSANAGFDGRSLRGIVPEGGMMTVEELAAERERMEKAADAIEFTFPESEPGLSGCGIVAIVGIVCFTIYKIVEVVWK